SVIGMRVGALSLLLLALVALTVVILIRVVGVILVLALLTMPAAVARHWTDALAPMMAVAAAVGAACITVGLFFSWMLASTFEANIPTGPAVILLTAVVFAGSAALRHLVPGRWSGTERAHPD
ncbi:MAG: metal ABC transporter permease, partial [Gemmatimonadota bacterium]